MIKQDVIERIRAETDIVELIGSYVPLRKSGRSYRGLCPFHPDRSPSFYVSPERETYHCFGCGAGGNTISFVMAQEKLDFPEAVRYLGKRLGIEIAEESAGRNRTLYDACEAATRYYEQQLRKNEHVLRYLVQRGISAGTVKRFRLGFAPPGNRLRGEQRRRSLPEDSFVKAGLLARRDNGLGDYFYDRVMFPVFSLSGRVIGFGGRVLGDREPKYLNSPDTGVFHKGDVLYGVFQAKGYIREEPPLLVEGNFDLLALVESGMNNVVAPLGTAFTTSQALLLRRYNRRVRICFDADPAGLKAVRRALEVMLKCGLEPEVVRLPDGSDPDDFVRARGGEALVALVGHPADFVEFVAGDGKFENVLDEREVVRELTTLLNLIPDDTTRELYANRISARFRVEKGALLRRGREPAARPVRTGSSRQLHVRLLAAAVQDAELARIARDLGLAELVSEPELQELARLSAEHCEDDGYGPAMLLDLIDSEESRKMVAGWTFSESALPPPADFKVRLQRLRASWLHRPMVSACEQGSNDQAERLMKERTELRQRAAQGGEPENGKTT